MKSAEDTGGKGLTTGSLLARNTIWNLLGQATPMGVALVAIPVLIHHIGLDRFGIITIAWMVVGYFSLFDLGLGRAMTNLVARGLGASQYDQLPDIIWTANGVMAVMGIVGALVSAGFSPLLVHSLLKIPPGLQQETLHSLYLLSAAVPLVISTAGFRGILEARQRFGLLNIIKIPMGIASFLAPIAVLPFTNNLTVLIGALVASRLVFLVACIALAMHEMPALRHRPTFKRALLRPLFSFGGWMTVSNIVGPVMVYADRFLIGSILSIAAVAYYATPYEVATKLWIIPTALVGVMFPAFSTAMVADRAHGTMLYRRATKYAGLILFPLSFLLVVFANDFLSVWLGRQFAMHSTQVLQILSIGVFTSSMAYVPFAMIQGLGRADITGKLHLLELPIYAPALWFLTVHYGIVGAAIAWLLRVTADAILLFVLADKVMGTPQGVLWPVCSCVVVGAIVIAATPLLRELPIRLIVGGSALALFGPIAWRLLLSAEERFALNRLIKRMPSRSKIDITVSG